MARTIPALAAAALILALPLVMSGAAASPQQNPPGDAASYCQVLGYVAPQVGFEIRLPAQSWNGKFADAGRQMTPVDRTAR